ncbi:YihY/virulence factor BrkB family protein [Oerskovia flava]|uniref:YihY/virulence factor BrkB family protein n=1 Tax=Oerskovia flava TaxID=2986422 RepID=UPI0022406BCA|nr:YihY/virulence factor BrkB family protein [Oerskovia sp. JB1-3-2]
MTQQTSPDQEDRGAARGALTRAQSLLERWQLSRPGRAIGRYGQGRGALLCGGIAYSALFSLFAALAIGYTVLMTVLGDREDLRTAVLEQVDDAIPGLVDLGEGGVLEPEDLLLTSGLGLTSVIAAVVLLVSAIAFVAALRTGVRAMFGENELGQSAVFTKLRELGGFVLIGLSVVVSAAAGLVVATVSTRFLDAIGLQGIAAGVVTAGGLVVSVLLDALVVCLVVVFLAGIRPPRRDLLLGSLVAGVAFGVLRYLGTSVIAGGASRNALLASFAVIVTLLLLVNFVARVLLMVCAWMADPPPVPRPAEIAAAHEAARRAEIEQRVVAGAGRGRPWSPIVRGVRRGRYPEDVVRTRG